MESDYELYKKYLAECKCKLALHHLKIAAETNADAQFDLAMHLRDESLGLCFDSEEYRRLMNNSAKNGSVYAKAKIDSIVNKDEILSSSNHYAKGLYYKHLHKNNPQNIERYDKKSKREFKLGAQSGCVYSQDKLGYIYFRNNDYSINEKAKKWLTMAADQGCTWALGCMGDYYMFDKDDDEKSLFYYHRAAVQGHKHSQFDVMHILSQKTDTASLLGAAYWIKKIERKPNKKQKMIVENADSYISLLYIRKFRSDECPLLQKVPLDVVKLIGSTIFKLKK